MLIRFVPAQLTRRSIDFPSIFRLIKLVVDLLRLVWLPFVMITVVDGRLYAADGCREEEGEGHEETEAS